MSQLYIRKATVHDIKAIHAMLLQTAGEGLLLPRPLNNLYNHTRDFYVLEAEDGSGLAGCCALSITWEDMAEIRSLVVDKKLRGQGWGRKLVEACVSEGVALGLYRIFTLTYQVEFFGKLEFVEVTKDSLPQKVWADCINCPKFPDCDEHAMLLEL